MGLFSFLGRMFGIGNRSNQNTQTNACSTGQCGSFSRAIESNRGYARINSGQFSHTARVDRSSPVSSDPSPVVDPLNPMSMLAAGMILGSAADASPSPAPTHDTPRGCCGGHSSHSSPSDHGSHSNSHNNDHGSSSYDGGSSSYDSGSSGSDSSNC